MKTNTKLAQLGDFLSLFNHTYPQYQQVPAGQPGGASAPQGMVNLGAQQQQQSAAPPQYVPQQQYAPQPQPTGYPAYAQPMVPTGSPSQYQAPPVTLGSMGYAQPSYPQGPDLDSLMRQNEMYKNQLEHIQNQQRQAADAQRQAELQSMKPMERVDAKLDLVQKGLLLTTERMTQYQMAYERERLMTQHNQELDSSKLNLSSLEALHASVPEARRSYVEFENKVAQRLSSQMGIYHQSQMEGLPPAPPMFGGNLPMSNRAGAVPVGPPQGTQPQYAQHPMMQDNYLQRGGSNPAYGRVYTPQGGQAPQPQANGNYFQSAYPQQPQYEQQQQYAPQQQYAQQYAQQYPQQPQQYAQTPRFDETSADALNQAKDAIMAARRGGLSRLRQMGMAEPAGTAMANSSAGGAQRMTHAQMPDPTLFAGSGHAHHPMMLAG